MHRTTPDPDIFLVSGYLRRVSGDGIKVRGGRAVVFCWYSNSRRGERSSYCVIRLHVSRVGKYGQNIANKPL